MMEIGADTVAGPDDDIFGVDITLHIKTRGRANRGQPGSTGPFTAKGAFGDRRPHSVKEGICAIEAVDEALMAQIAVRHDGLGAMLIDDGLPFAGNFIERLIPGNALELGRSLGTDTAHGMEQTIGMIVAFFIIFQLNTQSSSCHRMDWVSFNTNQFLAFNFIYHCTSIRAIVRTPTVRCLFSLNRHKTSFAYSYKAPKSFMTLHASFCLNRFGMLI